MNNNATTEYMDDKQKADFEKLLLEKRQQLMEDVDATVKEMKEGETALPDPVDRAAIEEEFRVELRKRDRERKLLINIDGALKRIKSDDFGYCELCGADIGVKRLEARPTATQCIDCKTFDEQKERRDRM